MGVDSKVFVEVDVSVQKTDVIKAVKFAIHDLVHSKLDVLRFVNHILTPVENYKGCWTVNTIVTTYDLETFIIHFGIGDENERGLWAFTTCRCDVEEYLSEGKDAVIFSIGAWGSNVEIIDTVIKAIKPFGKVFVDYNDCDDVEYQLVN